MATLLDNGTLTEFTVNGKPFMVRHNPETCTYPRVPEHWRLWGLLDTGAAAQPQQQAYLGTFFTHDELLDRLLVETTHA